MGEIAWHHILGEDDKAEWRDKDGGEGIRLKGRQKEESFTILPFMYFEFRLQGHLLLSIYFYILYSNYKVNYIIVEFMVSNIYIAKFNFV